MKVPCKDCLILALCKARLKMYGDIVIVGCPLVQAYLSDPNLSSERPMYRQTRVNKVRKAVGLKKIRRQKP